MYEEILGKLKELKDVYGKVLLIAREKRELLLKRDNIEKLNELVTTESELRDIAVALENARMELVETLAIKLGKHKEELTVSVISKLAPGLLGMQLDIAGNELLTCLREVRRANDINRQLIEINMSYSAFMLDAITNNNTVGNVYGADGSEEDYTQQDHRILDSEV